MMTTYTPYEGTIRARLEEFEQRLEILSNDLTFHPEEKTRADWQKHIEGLMNKIRAYKERMLDRASNPNKPKKRPNG